MRVARSSSDQWDTGVPASWGLVVASTKTLCRSSGGKSGRAAAAGQVAQAGEAVAVEAAAPAGDGVGIAAEFVGDLVVGRLVGLGAAEDDTGAEGEALRGGAGADQLLQQLRLAQVQVNAGGFAGHRQSLPGSRRGGMNV